VYLYFDCNDVHGAVHAFPTRHSSDLAAAATGRLAGVWLGDLRPGPDHVAPEPGPEADPGPAGRGTAGGRSAGRAPVWRPVPAASAAARRRPALAPGARSTAASPAGGGGPGAGLRPHPAGHGPGGPAAQRTAGHLAGPAAGGCPQPFRAEPAAG